MTQKIAADQAEGLKLLEDFILSHTQQSNTYALLFVNDGVFTVHEYVQRPCYGEMRMYNKTHPGEVKDSVQMPGDLNRKFPDGTPIAVAITTGTDYAKLPMRKFMYSANSPYKNAFKSIRWVGPEGAERGFILDDTTFDPTVLIHALISGQRYFSHTIFDRLSSKFGSKIALLLIEANSITGESVVANFGYVTSPKMNLVKYFSGEPRNISVNAETLHDRAVYNRPDLAFIFDNEDKKDETDTLETILPGYFRGKQYSVSEFAAAVQKYI